MTTYAPSLLSGARLLLEPATVAAAKAELARRNLADFVRQAWAFVEPEPLIWNWHLDAICLHLEAVTRGEIRKLLINVPPGHAKSLVVAVLWPAWIWTQRPEWRSLFASYAAELSTRDSVRCRQVIESEWYQLNFARPAGWGLRDDQNTKHNFHTTRGGFRYATSVGGGGTGHRGDLVAIDDPLNASDAHSKAARDEAIRWLGQTMSSRLNDMQTGRMVMIMQRLHEDDPSGFVLAGGGWEHLCLPSEFEPERRSVTHAVRSGERAEFYRDPRERPGELLFPAKFPQQVLDEAKGPNALGSYGFAGQHQQRPAPPKGGMFKVGNWRFWKPDGTAPDCVAQRPLGCYEGPARPLPVLDELILSLDANFKKKDDADPISLGIIGKSGADRFLLYRVHGPLGFTRTVEVMREACRLFPEASRKLIEAKANGDAIIETLQSEIGGIIAVDPEGGKEARAWPIQPLHEGGNCYLPDGAPWLDEFIAEFAAFPKGRHDDDVDMWSQGLLALRDNTSADLLRRIYADK